MIRFFHFRTNLHFVDYNVTGGSHSLDLGSEIRSMDRTHSISTATVSKFIIIKPYIGFSHVMSTEKDGDAQYKLTYTKKNTGNRLTVTQV